MIKPIDIVFYSINCLIIQQNDRFLLYLNVSKFCYPENVCEVLYTAADLKVLVDYDIVSFAELSPEESEDVLFKEVLHFLIVMHFYMLIYVIFWLLLYQLQTHPSILVVKF